MALLETRGLTIRFGGNLAVSDVDLAAEAVKGGFDQSQVRVDEFVGPGGRVAGRAVDEDEATGVGRAGAAIGERDRRAVGEG